MSTPLRLAAFAGGLVVVLLAAIGLGRLAGPVDRADTPVAHADDAGHGDTGDAGHGDSGDLAEAHTPAGLQVTEDGYRLVPESATLAVGGPQPFRFRILGPDGAAVTDYQTEHDKDLHLIVVRRDLSGFQHVHPELGADGTWSLPIGVAAAGEYRVFADFRPAGHDRGLTLGVDVPAPGDYRPEPLPAVAATATVDGYTVTVDGTLAPGTSSTLTLSISKDGVPVTDLQPYLGAYGHLVALREGDLAYLHVHPEGVPGDGVTQAGPGVTFVAEVPTAGTYRLYLDFRHGGQVRTAAFTAVAGDPVPAPAGSATPAPVAPVAPTTEHAPSDGGSEHGHG